MVSALSEKTESAKSDDTKLAFLFPGQGSQSVGMLAEHAQGEYSQVLRETFLEASDSLGYDLWELAQLGPEARLAETEVTQPLMLAAGVAVWRIWRAAGGLTPQIMAGHSLGEYTALVCAESLDFHEAMKLVQLRGRAMQNAVPLGEGAMLAVLGLNDEAIDSLCREVCEQMGSSGAPVLVAGANYNAPGQVVVGGYKQAVEKLAALAKPKGARKTIPVAMSAPSHTPLMQGAAQELTPHIQSLSIKTPSIPIIANVSAKEVSHPDDIRQALLKQICSPVRWSNTVLSMIDAGVTHCFECGPGKVLSSIMRRIDKQVSVNSLSKPDKMEQSLSALTDTLHYEPGE